MNTRAPIRYSARGFTLIEVLLAAGVFSIVLIAINSVYFSALRLRNRATEKFENSVPLQHALTIIKRDLEGLLLPGGKLSGQLQTELTATVKSSASLESTGERVSPDFYTATAAVDEMSPYSEVQKIAYYLALSTNSGPGRDLVRSVSRNLLPAATEQPEQQLLLTGVERVATLFYDGSAWMETWDTTTQTNLPRAVKIQLALAQNPEQNSILTDPIEVVVPVMLTDRTNKTVRAPSGGGQ